MNSSKYIPGLSKSLFLAFLFLLLGGCVRNEVTLEFRLPASVNDAYRIFYYASDDSKGWYVENVTMVRSGKGEVKCPTRNPVIVFLMHGGVEPEAGFYAERGDKIIIEGDNPSPFSWKISGNSLTDDWTAWRLKNRDILTSRNASDVNRVVASYVKENPGNPLSAILLCVYYDRRADEAGFKRLWSMLTGDAADPKWAEMIGRSDMLGGSPRFAADVSQFILHTLGNGVDTVRAGKAPMLLYFWRRSDDARYDDIQALRRLAGDFPDSASRFIADICFDPDSLSWRMPMQGDSLKNVVRAWSPRSETDSVFMRLGVARTPFFVVIDRKGKTVFRGENRDDASNAFRKVAAQKAAEKKAAEKKPAPVSR